MHKTFDANGAISRVTMTRREWRELHRDYKGTTGTGRKALVLCPVNGTTLVLADITPSGLPETEAPLPFRFPAAVLDPFKTSGTEQFATIEAATRSLLSSEFGNVDQHQEDDAVAQLTAFVLMASALASDPEAIR